MLEYINQIKVKKKMRLKISPCFYEGLDKEVEALLEKAQKRAEANKRRTVYKKDL